MNNFLKACYERLWVPIFGRMLMVFTKVIEGEKPTQKPTYDLREGKNRNSPN